MGHQTGDRESESYECADAGPEEQLSDFQDETDNITGGETGDRDTRYPVHGKTVSLRIGMSSLYGQQITTSVDWFNVFEILLWTSLGAVLFVRACTQQTGRLVYLSGTCVLLAFAGSDAVELVSGAWWRPWWLLVWKTICIGALFAVFVRLRAIVAQDSGRPTSQEPAETGSS